MGTKHGYTEKECKVCHEIKSREEFPAFGGLTCRSCLRFKENETPRRRERYDKEMSNPRNLENARRRAREYKRTKKIEQEGSQEVSISEAAQQLRETGSSAAEQISGVIGQIESDLSAIGGKLQQAQTIAEDSTNVAAQVLGEDHSGTGEIIGAAAQVVERIQEIQGLLSQFGLEATSIAERGGVLSQTFESVAARLMG